MLGAGMSTELQRLGARVAKLGNRVSGALPDPDGKHRVEVVGGLEPPTKGL